MNPLSAESRTIRSLKRLPLLESLDNELWAKILPHISITDLTPGETLFQSGRSSENLYVVVDGELGLQFDNLQNSESLELQTRVKGDTAGDFAVLNGGEHLVTAIAKKRTRLVCFPRKAFDRLSNIAPDVLAHVYETAAKLSQRVMIARVYHSLFKEIHADTLNELLEASSLHHMRNGEVLFEEGDKPDGLYIVVAGRLNVETTRNDGSKTILAEVHAHQTIGEYALLTDSTRFATVYATRESMVARLPRENFESIVMEQPKLLASITQIIVERQLLNARGTIEKSNDTNFVMVPLDSRLPMRRLGQQMNAVFAETEQPLSIDSSSFDVMYGKQGAALTGFRDVFSSSISAWMDDKENHFSHVIYVADSDWNAWTKRCINRADRIMLIASAREDNDSSQREVEEKIAELYEGSKFKPRIELVLVHPTNTKKPKDTERWLRSREIDGFHHIRIGDRQHVQRLYRRMSGKARGLVFSGGGARGYAHLGVHRAIEEQKYEYDYIGGASMGGLLSAAMAMGMSYNDIFELSKSFANRKALFDYTLPVIALMKSRKLTRFCREVYGDDRIEDLWIPYFCVSSNLANGSEVIHQRGYLWKAVRSTISLPGIFSPVPTVTGELLTDGSVLNTFPVDVMHRLLGGGSIVGCNVSQIGEIKKLYNYGTSLSGWKVFLSNINPFRDKIRAPRIAETLFRAADIKSIQRLNETSEMLDLLIEPDVSEIALLDFKSFARISDIGYAAANEVLFKQEVAESRLLKQEQNEAPQSTNSYGIQIAGAETYEGADGKESNPGGSPAGDLATTPQPVQDAVDPVSEPAGEHFVEHSPERSLDPPSERSSERLSERLSENTGQKATPVVAQQEAPTHLDNISDSNSSESPEPDSDSDSAMAS